MLRTRRATPGSKSPARGLSLVEFMVAIAVGMLLVAGAATMFASHISNSRRLLLEARLEQDLRSAADIVTRDLRRAGYWQNAIRGTIATGTASTTTSNPYAAVAASGVQMTYSYSRDTTENNALDTNEQFGFRLSGGTLQMQTNSGTWQAVTDPALMTVSSFLITPVTTSIDTRGACSRACCSNADVAAGTCATVTLSTGNCPTVTIRQYDVTLTGTAVSSAAVTRSLQTRVRVRNDAVSGTCPA